MTRVLGWGSVLLRLQTVVPEVSRIFQFFQLLRQCPWSHSLLQAIPATQAGLLIRRGFSAGIFGFARAGFPVSWGFGDSAVVAVRWLYVPSIEAVCRRSVSVVVLACVVQVSLFGLQHVLHAG